MSIRPKQNRIHSIDALRGFAIFGIFVVNIFVFHAPYVHLGNFYFAGNFEVETIEWMFFLFAGKFMFIFAFLFGYGAWMQFEKYDAFSAFQKFWWRRMFILAGIGILHIVFLSMGDILLAYAVLGLSLPLFMKMNNRILLICFLLIYLIPVYEFIIRPWLAPFSVFTQSKFTLEQYIEINQTGNFWELMKLRIYDFFSFRNEKLVMYMPKELSLFLLGILASRYKLASSLPKKKALIFCLIAIAMVIVITWFRETMMQGVNMDKNVLTRIVIGLIVQCGEFMHGMAYILGFWLLWSLKPMAKLLFFFTYVGKLSLTNYLMQSLIGFFLFTGYGLGWYGQLNPKHLILLAIVVFAGQSLFSYLWLRKYKFGPIEGLWRKLSYRD